MNFSDLSKDLNEELEKLSGSVGVEVEFIKTGETFLHNENKQFWAASVIKILIVCVVYKQIKEGKLDKEKRYVVEKTNRVDGSGIAKLFDEDTSFTLDDLVVLAITISDNSATNQLIDVVGADSIVEFISEVGLKDTTFRHKMMIVEGKGPNLITPRDVTKILKMLYGKELPGSGEILNVMKHTKLRDRIPDLLPNNIEISHKPGSLPKAMHEVGIVYSKTPFIFSFFSDDQEDKKLTKEVLSRCAKLCFDYSISEKS